MASQITRFRIDILQAAFDDMHERLAHTRWPQQIPGSVVEFIR